MSGRASTWVFWLGLLLALVVVAAVASGGTNRAPLDPRSVAPDGARALVETATRAGAQVELGVEVPGSDREVAVLLRDTYGFAARAELEAWVRAGGRLLVADPRSPLTPAIAGPLDGAGVGRGRCTVSALSDVAQVTGLEVAYAPGGADRAVCFAGGVAVSSLGAGTIVALGGAAPLVNSRLDEADNAVLALAILAPRQGTMVAFLEPRLVGQSGDALEDLVADPVWLLLIQLAVAFIVIACWQARRLGRPVPEPIPVEIAGSELAAARGRLLAGLRDPTAAAAELRSDAVASLGRAVGVGGAAAPEIVAAIIAERGELAESRVLGLLATDAVRTDADLMAVATGLAELRTSIDPAITDPRSAP